MPPTSIPQPTLYLLVVTFVIGLAVDAHADIVGQTLLGLACWGVLFVLLGQVAREARFALMACLALATAGELFLSLVWGLYTYRLDNIPLFVPPGHVFLFVLGVVLSHRLSDRVAIAIIGAMGVYSLWAAVDGRDTLGLGLFGLLLITSLALPSHRRLYASTLLLALAIELYGTALGNWVWARQVPSGALGLVTTNPPLAAGAFYCALDALVVATTTHVLPRLRRAKVDAGIAPGSA